MLNFKSSITALSCAAVALVSLSSCSESIEMKETQALTVREALAQKLMIDLRYYCNNANAMQLQPEQRCLIPVQTLDKDLETLISKSQVGGVILFKENIDSIEQVVQLNYDMQKAAMSSKNRIPLLIGIDQEGGRVARLPRGKSTPMSGAMAIGATYQHHGVQYATQSGKIIAKELKAAGFNLNFAPTVDVNVNPNNPVINVRSFGEDPQIVSELGYAQLDAMQKEGIVATLKHFPGHGDTDVDSHTGLPVVHHDKKEIAEVDLAPYAYAIEQGNLDMIMTAHIQFPALDNTTFVAKDGKVMAKPATMSRKILTDLLKHEMKYNGLIITDALDMAGISHFFDETQAVIETFNAGADIALMPLRIRTPDDLTKLDALLDSLVDAVNAGKIDKDEILASANKILNLKQQYKVYDWQAQSIAKLKAAATNTIGNKEHKAVERELALASTVVVKGQDKLPLKDRNLHIVMPDLTKCDALVRQFKEQAAFTKLTCSSLSTSSEAEIDQYISEASTILFASITPKQSAVELGGMEDLDRVKQANRNKTAQDLLVVNAITKAKSLGKQTVFISLRTPYEMTRFDNFADVMVATFSYNTYETEDDVNTVVANGPAYEALARLLIKGELSSASLPVTVFSSIGE